MNSNEKHIISVGVCLCVHACVCEFFLCQESALVLSI